MLRYVVMNFGKIKDNELTQAFTWEEGEKSSYRGLAS